MNLSDRLNNLRRDRDFTLRELRERILEATGEKIAISYLSSLERSEGVPSIDTLTKIAAGYGMSLREILEPVDFYRGSVVETLPPGLKEFAERKPEVSHDQLVELSRIEFRGARPETADEWETLYRVLDGLFLPKLKSRN